MGVGFSTCHNENSAALTKDPLREPEIISSIGCVSVAVRSAQEEHVFVAQDESSFVPWLALTNLSYLPQDAIVYKSCAASVPD